MRRCRNRKCWERTPEPGPFGLCPSCFAAAVVGCRFGASIGLLLGAIAGIVASLIGD